jgi:AcrR family transcriptional regulator
MAPRSDTKKALQDAALRLFVENGVAGTSIRDLTRAVGITEAALYRHYAGKEDLIRDLFEEHYAAFARHIDALQAIEKTLREKMRVIVNDACKLFDENPTLYRFLLLVQHEALPRLSKDADSPAVVIRAMMGSAIAAGESRIKNNELAAALFLGLLVQPALSIIHGALTGPLSLHADSIVGACERAIAE